MSNITKIVILGNSEAGKTSITNLLRGIDFSFHYKATLGFDSNDIMIISNNEEKIDIQLLEFSGQEVYYDIRDSFDWDAKLAILVIDATKQEALYNISTWLNLAKNQGIEKKDIIICLNKIDMIDFIAISFEDLYKTVLSEDTLPKIILSSAHTKVGQQRIIDTLIKMIIDY